MATKISGFDNIAAVGAGRAAQPSKQTPVGTTQGASGQDADIQITGAARQLAGIEQAIRDTPTVNEARVTQLRTAIEQGTYAVRPEHVASQLTQMEQALGRLVDPPRSDSADPSPQSQK